MKPAEGVLPATAGPTSGAFGGPLCCSFVFGSEIGELALLPTVSLSD